VTIRYEAPVLVSGNGYILYQPPPTSLEGLQRSVANPYESSSDQRWALGTKLEYGLQTFRYAKNGGSTGAPGKLFQSVVPLAGHIDEAISTALINALVVGFTPAVTPTDDLVKDELADGLFWTNGTEAGLGQMYRIRSHPAIVGGVEGEITLWDAIRVTFSSSLTGSVYHNPYRGVIIHPSPPTAHVIGVWPRAVPSSEYAWIQTRGPCPVLGDGTLVIARAVMPSASVDGAVSPWTFTLTEGTPNVVDGTENRKQVGYVMTVAPSGDYSLIFLEIDQ